MLYNKESIILAIIVFVLLLPVLIVDRLNQRPIRRSRDARITKWLMFGVIASNALHQTAVLAKFFICAHCIFLWSSWGVTKAIVKVFNQIFLIHRAKLVQGITPVDVLSTKWFEQIFPAFIVVIGSGFIFASINMYIGVQTKCSPYDDWDGLYYCDDVIDPEAADEDSRTVLVACAIGLELLITAFLVVLFMIPLYRVYKLDLGGMNSHQLEQRKKLKHLLIWAVVLTLINQVTSTLILAVAFPWDFPFLLEKMGECDAVINVWTAWLMLTRNREYMKRLCCCECCRKITAVVHPDRRGEAEALAVRRSTIRLRARVSTTAPR